MVFVIEEFLSPVIGRPSADAVGVPAGDDPRIGPGPKGDTIGHSADFLPSRLQQRVCRRPPFPTLAILNRRHGTDRGQKKTQDSAELASPLAQAQPPEDCYCRGDPWKL